MIGLYEIGIIVGVPALIYLVWKHRWHVQLALLWAAIFALACSGLGFARLADTEPANDLMGIVLLVLGIGLLIGIAVVARALFPRKSESPTDSGSASRGEPERTG